MNRISLLLALMIVTMLTACRTLSRSVAPLPSTGTNAATTAPMPAQVVVIGTLHGLHHSNANYSLESLREMIVSLKPSAILVEIPPKAHGQLTVRDDRCVKGWDEDENMAANQAADALGAIVVPFDRENRQETYESTCYFPRQNAACKQLNHWAEAQDRKDTNSIPVLACRLLRDACARQQHLCESGEPKEINSADYDMIIAAKHEINYGVLPTMLAASGQLELAGEFRFFGEEWRERNRIIARHIQDIAHRFPGKRLVVLTGSEHRYVLRELLNHVREIEVKEFYQIREQPNTTQAP